MSGPAPGDDLFQFPCDFPLKVMGRDTPEFRATARAIIEKHAPPLGPGDVSERSSSNGNFIGVLTRTRCLKLEPGAGRWLTTAHGRR